jgi:hypothetical protein
VGLTEGAVPVETVEVLAIFVTKGVVMEQGHCKLFKDPADNLSVGWTEVSAKGLAAREEQLV